jgi:predicted nucleic acid-binding protein
LSLFVDTSVWYAAADRSDRENQPAKELLGRGEELITTDHVLVETWLLMHHRLGEAAAGRFWAGLRAGAAHMEAVVHGDLDAAWRIGEDFPDQDFSIVDRTSFAVMERLGVHRAASLDSDFAIYRFGARRDRSFTIVS